MLNWILSLVGLGQYNKTFDQVVAPINKVISDLEKHVEMNSQANEAKKAQADALIAAAAAHKTEAERAAAATEKFKALVSA